MCIVNIKALVCSIALGHILEEASINTLASTSVFLQVNLIANKYIQLGIVNLVAFVCCIALGKKLQETIFTMYAALASVFLLDNPIAKLI